MRNKPVDWSEGMFLRPHHFQAAERHINERIRTGEQWDNPYNYGLFSFDHSKEALANQHFEVRGLKARMRDGTLIEGGVVLELDLATTRFAGEFSGTLVVTVEPR